MTSIKDVVNGDKFSRFENPDELSNALQEVKTVTLTSGKSLSFPLYLAGGGDDYKKYFLKAVAGKKYNNAFEWCAGHGIMGFELITNDICKTLTFSDCYDKSTEWCLKNAEQLGLQDRIFAYTSDIIGNIPFEHKFDLVIGNPPNSMGFDKQHIEKYFTSEDQYDGFIHYLRINYDKEFSAHEEFFNNLHSCITDDADILITAQYSYRGPLAKISNSAGFEMVKITDMPPDPNLKIFHYKSM